MHPNDSTFPQHDHGRKGLEEGPPKPVPYNQARSVKGPMGDNPRSQFCLPRAAVLFLSMVATSLFWASPLNGQIQRTVGFHVGQVQSRQLWSGTISSANATGPTVGVNVDVPTPASFLSIRAEASYIRRGSVVWDDALDPEHLTPAQVRSHYLTVPILGKGRLRLGPGSIYLLAGPYLDILLDTQCSEDLCSVLNDERPSTFGVTVGAGVSIDFRDRFRADFEVKLSEGLSDAYVSPSSSTRYRSSEFLLRACFPF